jgi:hypothetical protein
VDFQSNEKSDTLLENYDIYTYYNMLKNMENKTSEFIKSLLRELGVRSIDGMPDLKREDNIQHIYQILMEWGYSYSDADSFIQSLTEGSDPKDGVELSKAAKSTIDSQKLDHMGYGFYGKRGETKVDDTIMFKKLDNGELGSATKDQYDDEVENQQKLAGNADKKKDKEEETEEETPDQSSGGGESNIFDTPSGKSYMRDIPDNDPVKSKTESINIDDVLREVITILIEDDDVYSQKIKNPESGREVMVKTALSSKEHPAYQKAKSLVDKETSDDDETSKDKTSGDDENVEELTPAQKSKIVSDRIKKDDESFESATNKDDHTIEGMKNRNNGINDNDMLPPGNTGSSFAENNGSRLVNRMFEKGGNTTKEEDEEMMNDMMNSKLGQSLPEKDRKRWAKIALETAKTEAKTLLSEPKYNAKNPQPKGYPQGAIMDKQNKAHVNRLLAHKLEEAKKSGDEKVIKHYEKQLKYLDKLSETDSGVLYVTNDGSVGFKHTSNKSSYDDPHNNTSPNKVMDSIKESMGDNLDPNVVSVFESSFNKLANASSGVPGDTKRFMESRKSKSKEEIQKENEVYATVLKDFPVRGGSKDYLYGSESVSKKKWFKKYAQEKGLTEPYNENDIMNAVFENASSDNPDSSASKIVLKLSEVVEKATPENIQQLAKKYNLPEEDMKKMVDSTGEYFKNTASTRRDVMAEVHTEMVTAIQTADSKDPNSYPSNSKGDNGPHQQAYVDGYLKRMHFDSYIMGDRDGVASQNIGGDNVEPEYYRKCLAELTGFDGDTDSEEGRQSLLSHLKKRVRVTPGGDSISFESNDGRVVKLGVDKYRTKGDAKGVLGGLGKDLQKCLKSKIKK